MERVLNFSAGPAALPLSVLEKAQKELVVYGNTGMSVMEMSHRSKMYLEIIGSAEANLRKLMAIPDNYKVLFLQGGASLQFAMVPLNLFDKSKEADYVNTGMWSKKAIAEAKKFGSVNVVASSEDKNFNYIPDIDTNNFNKNADYFHITMNNTIFGTRITKNKIPDTGNIPLVTDMSSSILSEVYDVSKFGVIYAGAQKNIGPSGMVIVIIREDLIGKESEKVPTMLSYKTHADNASMYNTPPTFGIYIAKLIFEWLLELGGTTEMEKINNEKASILYDFLDNSKIFSPTVQNPHRSLMNVPFLLPNEDMNNSFIKEAELNGLTNLKGHRSVGGMRASIYNAVSIDDVKRLVKFMKKFEGGNI